MMPKIINPPVIPTKFYAYPDDGDGEITSHTWIECKECGSIFAYMWYSKKYKGYMGACLDCDDQWKMS